MGTHADTERDLIPGTLAGQSAPIDADQLAETCATWEPEKSASTGGPPVAKGLPDEAGRADLGATIDLTVQSQGGDSHGTQLASAEALRRDVGDPAHGALQPTIDSCAGSLEDTQRIDDAPDPGGHRSPAHVRISALDRGGESRDRYTRTHLHARGGIGQVWLARDGSLGREVALKELRPEKAESPGVSARFLYEAKVTGQLEHPGIVPVYELADAADGRGPYYTMRFIRGKTLSEAIRDYHEARERGGDDPVALRDLLMAFVAVCNAVGYAHSRGVIHRDLKGANVVLGDFGEVMVLDWGLAKVAGQAEAAAASPFLPDREDGHEETREGQILGTPAYMAPEQADGRLDEIDSRTDIYGLGAILYEVLAGRPPFTASKLTELLEMVRDRAAEPPGKLNPGAPPALGAVCLKALAKKPADRYATATELADEVRRWLADEPVLAYPEPFARRAWRWAKRHRTAVAAAGALAASAVVALGVGNVLIARERDEARLQRQQARQAVDDMYTGVAEQWLEDRHDPLQRQFLEKALHYYENFTRQDAREPQVRLERGRAFLRLADIRRKLGQNVEARQSYARAVEVLGALAADRPGLRDARHHLARAQGRLAVHLVGLGDYADAEGLLAQGERGLEDLASGPGATADDRRELAFVRKVQGDLKRLTGHFEEAGRSYRRAIADLGPLRSQAPADLAVRRDLAAAHEALGQLDRELGRPADAVASYRAAMGLQETLLAESPTVPTLREALARTYNSLALLLLESGPAPEAEPYLRRELQQFERLAGDFPDRPEYRRTLARSSTNLGIVLRDTGRTAEAEGFYRRAIDLNAKLAAEAPEVVQYRLDLAKCLNNLADLLGGTGRFEPAEVEYRRALALAEPLAADHPEAPRHRFFLAVVLKQLAGVGQDLGRPDAEANYGRALALMDGLVASYPDDADYRKELAKCLGNYGTLVAAAGRKADAETAYRKALDLDAKLLAASPAARDVLHDRARVLSNLGELRLPGAEDVYARSLAAYEALLADPAATIVERRERAIVQYNLGDMLAEAGRGPDAGRSFEASARSFEAIAADFPKSAEDRSLRGLALEGLGRQQEKAGRLADARATFEHAAGAGREAVERDRRQPGYRDRLRGHLSALAGVLLALDDPAEAARVAGELARVAPDRAAGTFEAATILARCVAKAGPGDRADGFAARALFQLREAADADPKLADRLEADASFESIRKRPDFQTFLQGLAASAPAVAR
ncbi:MAG TPA: serine/threonine-protein kinase [Isosphaeraceae bacterium]|jgi:tetratricopeptide (TPR) repeat protein/tRNA A-37 threonylcarbamoyl transferase component Bud32|nr:serine/threonine-protein kinase [Isosphaeraceae bacterium]